LRRFLNHLKVIIHNGMRSKKVLIGIGIGIFACTVSVFFWAKQPTAPFPLYQLRCQITGGESRILKTNSFVTDSDSSYSVCMSKKAFPDVGKKCETDSDCAGMCESVMDDVYYPRLCTNRIY
jgi:hypothetical protein